jgi:hypothetical protein
MKIAGLPGSSGTMRIYAEQDMPLRFDVDVENARKSALFFIKK